MNIYVKTLGCPKNEYDSQCFIGDLLGTGHTLTDMPERADIIIVNTCGFIQDAKVESIEAIFDLSRLKQEGAGLFVTGCLSERYMEDLYREIPEVDIILGVHAYESLPSLIAGFKPGKRVKSKMEAQPFKPGVPARYQQEAYSSTLKISEGCDNHCTYCVIPDIRGPFRSRPMDDVLAEARVLAGNGARELILIAQDVTAYGMDLYGKPVLTDLLKQLCRIQEVSWIRLMYCYEDRITDDLIELMASEPKICHYIDLPLQHISGKILAGMHRRSTPLSIKKTIGKLRSAIKDIHIRTTFIVGFPGETEEDFLALQDFVRETKFERIGVFAYSREEGTPAGDREDQVDDDIKERRRELLMLDQLEISRQLNLDKVGQVLEVLLTEPEGEDVQSRVWIGRSRYDAPEIDQSVIVSCNKEHNPGDLIQVRITDGFDYDLTGMEV